jgi:hypothetical protein
LPGTARVVARDSDCTYAAVWRELRSVNPNAGISVPGMPLWMMSAIDFRSAA